jgi:hypothetical protein
VYTIHCTCIGVLCTAQCAVHTRPVHSGLVISVSPSPSHHCLTLSVSQSKHTPSHIKTQSPGVTHIRRAFTQMINDHALHSLLSITCNLFYAVYLYMSYSITCCNETRNRHTITLTWWNGFTLAFIVRSVCVSTLCVLVHHMCECTVCVSVCSAVQCSAVQCSADGDGV